MTSRFCRYKLWLQAALLLGIAVGFASNARAEYVQPIGFEYSAGTVPGQAKTYYPTPQEAAAKYIDGLNAYYSYEVKYTLLKVYVGMDGWWVMDYKFEGTWDTSISQGVMIIERVICPPGYISGVAYRLCWRASPPPPPPAPTLAITSTPPVIPDSSRVANGKVLTASDLTLTLLNNGQAAAGKQLHPVSDRGTSVDTLKPANAVVTDTSGKATAKISTRSQPGTSTVRVSETTVTVSSPGVVAWLPAKYETDFLVTCYTIADEASEPPKPTLTKVCGLPETETYRASFLADVKMQGSGVALNGTIIHYAGKGCYNIESCARTATGACAAVGTTIAVDPTVIPKRSTVNGNVVGQRKAQDTGGMIKGYHIDEYMGPQPKLCKQLGRRTSGISLLNY